MKVLIRYRSMSTSAGRVRNGDIVDLSEEEIAKIRVTKPGAIEVLPQPEAPKPAAKKAPAKKAPAKRKPKVAKPID